MDIKLKRLETQAERNYFVELLYANFPITERRAEARYEYLLTIDHPYYRPYIIIMEDEMVGIVDSWDYSREGRSFQYIEHLAITDKYKNKKIGSKALLELATKYDTTLFECEFGTDEMSIRRLGMYDRLGAKIIDREYAQPPLHTTTEYLPMHLMYFGEEPSEAEICFMIDTVFPLHYVDKIIRDSASKQINTGPNYSTINDSEDEELRYVKALLNKSCNIISLELKKQLLLWYSPTELGIEF